MQTKEGLLLMTETAMGTSVLDALPEALERLPLRVVQEALTAEILERGCGIGATRGGLTPPDFDEELFHE